MSILLNDCMLPQFERSKHTYTSVSRKAYHLGKAPRLLKFCGETIFCDLRMKSPNQENCRTCILAVLAKVKVSSGSIFFIINRDAIKINISFLNQRHTT